jgi:alkanesulfonate monooxygenase SsuD/methylene tetrahydromethanopterin reductase-like flavin-dependent oxidoreductase (luciferase family)
MLGCAVVGDPAEARAGLQTLKARTQADAFIIVLDIFDANARKHSRSRTAEVWGLQGA